MHADLANLGWTEDQWNRIASTVTEEAQRARVAAQALPTCGPEDPSVVAVPRYALGTGPAAAGSFTKERLEVNSDPDLHLSTIAVNVELRTADVADSDLRAALIMFRRAANIIARIEDTIVFNGHGAPVSGVVPPVAGLAGISSVFTVHGRAAVAGLLGSAYITALAPAKAAKAAKAAAPTGALLVKAIINAISGLEARGQLGPFACVLNDDLFELASDPTPSLVMPRDRILPFLQGPLLRSSTIAPGGPTLGVIIALGGEPVEIVVASDIGVRYMQATLEPRYVFRVSERVALRIKDASAIQLLQ
jgi:uncharacterized linocin/CFP29 family protein